MSAPSNNEPANVDSRQLYLRLLRQIKPYKAWFAGGIAAMIVLALTEAGIPAILKPVLDGTFVDKDPSFMAWAPLAIIALFLVRGTSGFISQVAFANITTRVVYDLRRRMFDQLIALPTTHFDGTTSGSLISKLTYDVTQVTEAGTEVITVLVKDTTTVIALLAYVFWLDWQLSLFTFLLGPIIAGVAIVAGRRMRRLSRQLQAAFGDLTHVLEETTRGHKVIKIFGGQDYERERFDKTANWVRRLQFKFRVVASASVPIVEFMGAVILSAIIYLGVNRTDAEAMTVGGFVAFVGAIALMFSPIKRLTKVNDPLQRGLAAAESIFGLLDSPTETDKGTTTPGSVVGSLEFRHVSLAYRDSEENSLHDINLSVPPHSTVALVGPSGSGKSSLVNLIPRFYTPSQGIVLLDDHDIADLPLAFLRRQIAYVGQDVVLFNDTVAANIAYGTDADRQAVTEAAEAAGAMEFIKKLPAGLATEIGENGVRLSGGQRQRLAIARALLEKAPILVLDEATSSLDTRSERHVQTAVEHLKEGRTTIIIAHRLSTIESADHIVVMDRGKIVEQGRHDSLMQAGGLYQQLYQNQQLQQAD